MALIAWNTDAPVYHWPYATVGLIGVNTAAYVATWNWDEATLRSWSLTLGDGLHPLQWITASFLHASLIHLIGNMFFLWACGLVVEGKVGWLRFLGIYFGLALACNVVEQIAALGSQGGHVLGASDVIFGLLALAVVWAPENEIEFVYLFGLGGIFLRTHHFSARIWKVALWYVGWSFFETLMLGFKMTGALSHLVGAALGFPLGWWLLNTGRVDCEGWDMFTLLEKRNADRKSFERSQKRAAMASDIPPAPGELPASTPPVATTPESGEKGLQRFRKLLDEQKGAAALALHEKITHFDKRWKIPEPELVRFIDVLHGENRLVESIPFMEDYLERFAEQEVNLRLRLARILIEQQQRPSYALRVMAPLSDQTLPEAMDKLRTRLQQEAQRLIDDGVLELEGKAWQ